MAPVPEDPTALHNLENDAAAMRLHNLENDAAATCTSGNLHNMENDAAATCTSGNLHNLENDAAATCTSGNLHNLENDAAAMRLQLLRSMAEYRAINIKPVQHTAAARCGIHFVPLVVLEPHAQPCDISSGIDNLQDMLRARPELEPHVQNDSFVMRPAVGACAQQGNLDLELGSLGQRQFARQVQKHMAENPSVREWLLQPYIKGFAMQEYRVFLGGPHAVLQYSPIYRDHDGGSCSASIFCPDGHIYSEAFAAYGLVVDGQGNKFPATWSEAGLHGSIVNFARVSRHKFLGHPQDFRVFKEVMSRVDVVTLYPMAAEYGTGTVGDLRQPLILLNELDNLGSASLLLDLDNPKQDSLASCFPARHATQHVRAERQPCQQWSVYSLQQLLHQLMCL